MSRRVRCSIDVVDETCVKYLEGLKQLKIPRATFVTEAILYYIPHHLEKVNAVIRYCESIKLPQKGMNEE